MKPAAKKKTVQATGKTVKTTRPGRNGGRLNAGPGPGRPTETEEQKAAKALFRTAKSECSDILQELVTSGRLRTFLVQAIEHQAKSGRIDGVRWLCEYVDPPNAPGTKADPSELLESILAELEKQSA